MARIKYNSGSQTFLGAYKCGPSHVELKFDAVSVIITVNEAGLILDSLTSIDGNDDQSPR